MKLSSPQPNAQTLWLYLLTGPHNTVLPGIFILGEMGLAESMGWDIKSTKEKIKELADEGMLEVDPKTKVIILPTAILYNPPESPQTPTAWARQFASIPECPSRDKFLKYLVKYMSEKADLKNKFLKAFQAWLTEEQRAVLINVEAKPDPRINEFLNFYNDEFIKKFKTRPVNPHTGENGKHIKDLLRIKDLDELKNLLIEFFNSTDKYIRNSGYTIRFFRHSFQTFLTKNARTLNHYKDLS